MLYPVRGEPAVGPVSVTITETTTSSHNVDITRRLHDPDTNRGGVNVLAAHAEGQVSRSMLVDIPKDGGRSQIRWDFGAARKDRNVDARLLPVRQYLVTLTGPDNPAENIDIQPSRRPIRRHSARQRRRVP